MERFYFQQFDNQVKKALETVQTIIDNTKEPKKFDDIPHVYQDKYLLANFITNATLLSQMKSLELIGLTPELLKKLKTKSQTNTIILSFKTDEKREFIKEHKYQEKSKKSTIETKGNKKKETYTENTIIEYYWKYTIKYEIFAWDSSSNKQEKITFYTRESNIQLKTSTEKTPFLKQTFNEETINFTKWLKYYNLELKKFNFSIQKLDKNCFTPRRNEEINEMFEFFQKFYSWLKKIELYFQNLLSIADTKKEIDLSIISMKNIFNPVLPIFNDENSLILSCKEFENFLNEQQRTIYEKFDQFNQIFEVNEHKNSLTTVKEGKILLISIILKNQCKNFSNCLNFIEEILKKQFISSIGKELNRKDFNEFINFYCKKLFKKQFIPIEFCFSIRRSNNHSPEGIFKILSSSFDHSNEQILCYQKEIQNQDNLPMNLSINSSTKLKIYGKKYFNIFLNHCFSNSLNHFELSARACQLSSFILILGDIISSYEILPKHAIIIKDKDDILIPLLLHQIPNVKEFKNSIQSLSTNQKEFAKAFRSMQLQSSLFGICIIQIKPQLEKILNLPNDSLTKEIQLTSDLMDLFISYQVPSDVLSYDGDDNDNNFNKTNKVKKYVKNIHDMIQNSKENSLQQENLRKEAAGRGAGLKRSRESYGGEEPAKKRIKIYSEYSDTKAERKYGYFDYSDDDDEGYGYSERPNPFLYQEAEEDDEEKDDDERGYGR